jgi:hypothetical protein
MPTNQNPPSVRIVLFGADRFPKDPELPSLGQAATQVEALQRVLTPQYVPGAEADLQVDLLNVADNTRIKEELARAAAQSPDLLLVYYVGYAVFRRSQWYLTTANSSLAQVHVNGISLAELVDTIDENEQSAKLVVLDCAYLHTPEAGAELWQYAHEELHRAGDALRRACLFMASPRDAAYQREPRLAPLLARLLEGGLRKNSETLNLTDAHDYFYEQFRQAGKASAAPLRYAPAEVLGLAWANNLKYQAFLHRKQEADQQFDEEDFAAALPIYEEAKQYYDADDDVNAKTRFITLALEAERQFGQAQFGQAKKNYELAQELFDLAWVRRRTDQAIEEMAEAYFKAAQYEQAKTHYARLAATHPDRAAYAERLQTCIQELKYGDLIDSADSFYFQFDFENALRCYREALGIHEDRRTKRRMEECAQFMDRRAALREQLEAEIAKRVKAEAEQQFNAQFAEMEQARLAELSRTLTAQVQAQTQATLAQQGWEWLAQQPSPEGYELFVQLFPQSDLARQAEGQARQLRAQQAQLVPPNWPVAQPAEELDSPNGHLPATNGHDNGPPSFVGSVILTPLPEPPTAEVSVEPSALGTAEPLSEEDLWQKVVSEDTVEAFLRYINQTEASAHLGEAYYRIGQLRSQSASEPEEVASQPPPASHDEPTNDAINLAQAPQTETQLTDEELLWRQTVAENSIQGYQGYLAQYPVRGHADEARAAMIRLQEAAKMEELRDWEMVTSADTLEAYKAYINKYPFGNYYAKARFRIAKLEAEVA